MHGISGRGEPMGSGDVSNRYARQGRVSGVILALYMLLFFPFLGMTALEAQEQDPAREFGDSVAEKLIAEGSFKAARERYQSLNRDGLSQLASLWREFRLADTQWRSQFNGNRRTGPWHPEGISQLEKVQEKLKLVDGSDAIDATIEESLGDLKSIGSGTWNRQPWNGHYLKALDFWAAQKPDAFTRNQYLDIARKLIGPRRQQIINSRGVVNINLSYNEIEPLLDAFRISVTDEDKVVFASAVAGFYGSSGTGTSVAKAHKIVSDVIPGINQGIWKARMLFTQATLFERPGIPVRMDSGHWTFKQNLKAAITSLEQVIASDKNNESGLVQQAEQKISQFKKDELSIHSSGFFKSNAKIQIPVTMRNIGESTIRVVPIDLDSRLTPMNQSLNANEIANLFRVPSGNDAYKTVVKNPDFEDHLPVTREVVIEEGLKPGAYLIVGDARGEESKALLLVTDAMLTNRTHADGISFFVSEAVSGKPIPGVDLNIFRGIRSTSRRNDWSYRQFTFKTDESGLLTIDGNSVNDLERSQTLVFGDTPLGPVFYLSYSNYYRHRGAMDTMQYYQFTDRPAYRPGDSVNWKLIARIATPENFKLPGESEVQYQIQSSRGTKIDEGVLKLNAFGSGSSSFDIPMDANLGEYYLELKAKGDKSWNSRSMLFRLEEYKLPDFFVNVKIPEVDGKAVIVKPGEDVEVAIEARYYFGAPVQDGEVEVIVTRRTWNSGWPIPRPEPWYMRQSDSESGIAFRGRPAMGGYGGNQVEILRKSVVTDANGVAQLTFPADNLDVGVDYQFDIVANVTDASRVMVSAKGTVKVTEKPYFTRGHLKNVIHKPGDLIKVEWKFKDANDNPFAARGQVVISKRIPNPDYVKPEPGKYRILPHPAPDEFTYLRIDAIEVDAGPAGEAETQWRPEEPGLYQFTWIDSSIPPYLDNSDSVTAWVMDENQSTVHYRSGGVEIILDSQTVEAGEEALFVVTCSEPDGFVWLGFESEGKWEHQIIQLSGNAKILRRQVGRDVAKNFFIHALHVRDYQLFSDIKDVIVPPAHKIASLELIPDKESFLPGSHSKWQVLVKDADGNPISGELALSIYDRSLEYIQSDIADPVEKFFYGRKYRSQVRYQSMLNFGAFQNLYAELEDTILEANVESSGHMRKSAQPRFQNQMFRGIATSAMADSEMVMDAAAPMSLAANTMVSGDDSNASQDAPQIRSDFRKTAYWKADIVTDTNGKAEIEFDLPESLTEWNAIARYVDKDTRVVQATTSIKTATPVSVRIEVPRFLIVGDQCVLAASVINSSDTSQNVHLSWVTGDQLKVEQVGSLGQRFTLAAGEERVVDLKTSAIAAGEAMVRAMVRTPNFSDAVEESLPIAAHGFDKLVFRSGKADGNNIEERITLPGARDLEQTRMVVRVTPSMSVAMLDALPYLIEYPYGCTEQTMSRFVPAVVVTATLKEMELKPEDIKSYIHGGIEKSYAMAMHPDSDHKVDNDKLDRVIRESLQRLYDFQNASGGWGWWENSPTNVYMSAYVVWGLSLASQSGLDVDRASLERGLNFLLGAMGRYHGQPEMMAWILRSITSAWEVLTPGAEPSGALMRSFESVWKEHSDVDAYTRSLLALTAHSLGEKEKARLLVRNLENGAISVDGQSTINRGVGQSGPAMIHWGKAGRYYRWYESGVESTATAINAISRINPESPLLQPAVNWLLAQRRAASWSNTKDTSISILALHAFLNASGELEHGLDASIFVNDKLVQSLKMNPKQVLSGPGTITVPADYLKGNQFQVKIINHNAAKSSPIYFNIEARYRSLEIPIQPSGNTVFAKRTVHELQPFETLLRGIRERDVLLGDSPVATSGNKVKVTLTIEAKQDLEYVIIEDFKPAGMEFENVVSGGGLQLHSYHYDNRDRLVKNHARSINAYNEWRDNRVVLFIENLPEGIWEVEYLARIQTPGKFHALPVSAQAMYVPEIMGNGLEHIWAITDAPSDK